MKLFPSSPAWNWAFKELNTEFNNFIISARLVAANAFIGNGNAQQTEDVKNTRFSNLLGQSCRNLVVTGM